MDNMLNDKEVINNLFVDVFNDILQIEEFTLKSEGLDNLSVKEIHVLDAIGTVEEPTMSNVSAKLRVTIGTLTTAINTLVKKGYVVRVECKDDKRVVRLKLTETGEAAFDIHKEFHYELVDQTVKILTKEDMDALAIALAQIHVFFGSKMMK